ncbi:ERI1 exoribonuclease 3 [Armadillidium nasatum]|uniref:ERI1 exoribonuclease 3 n=1 Tax=Armadillidium nasatum TaxID=96803 RepID=A0A5N5T9N2_9CRUS|nr:ERI1 exoribonuclease 3 [Armadillidium nasatum]
MNSEYFYTHTPCHYFEFIYFYTFKFRPIVNVLVKETFMFRIHSNLRVISRQSHKLKMPAQNYDSFLVLDFEATCQEGTRISRPEIIEFPVLKVDGRTFDVTEKFHSYVRPVLNPQLTDFCTKLTGITQEMVESSDTFPTVFGSFQTWLLEKVGPKERFLFVTCGDWDLKSMLPDQCKRECIVLPPYFNTWMNIKKAYAHVTGVFTKGMLTMLNDLKLEHIGRHHSGIDDCTNIVSILKALNDMGCVFRPTAGDSRHGPPPPPQLASYAGSFPSSNSAKTCNYDPPEKSSLYPSLNSGDMPVDGAPGQPDFQAIILDLKENLFSKRFKPRDQEELQTLCASGKYLHLMEPEDRRLVESRLRYFYIILVHGRKVAEKDSQTLSTETVGIRVDPSLLHHSLRHKDKTSSKYHHHHHKSHKYSKGDGPC